MTINQRYYQWIRRSCF